MTGRLGRGPVADTIGLEARSNAIDKVDAIEDVRFGIVTLIKLGHLRPILTRLPLPRLHTLGHALQRAAAENA